MIIGRNLIDPEVPHEQEEEVLRPDSPGDLEILIRESRRRRSLLTRVLALILVVSFFVLAYRGFLYLAGMPSLEFLIESVELSKDPRFSELKKAVVSVQAGNRQGTGFNIYVPGLIITNDHIIQDARQVQIGLRSNELQPAATWKQWPQLDLALIRVDAANLPVIELEQDGFLPKPGETLTLIGNPLGLFQIVTQVEYVGLAKLINFEKPVLMVRGSVFPGNSGSPVLNADGKAVGILFAVADEPEKDQKSIGYVISVQEIRQKLDEYKALELLPHTLQPAEP